MVQAIIGQRSGNAIVPYSQTTKRTKEYDFSSDISDLSSLTNFNVVAATGIAYADSNGSWRFAFNISTTFQSTSVNDVGISIANIKFRNVANYYQSLTAGVNTSTDVSAIGVAVPNTGTIYTYIDPNATNISVNRLSGDVALEEEPTWAAANMEANTQADIYIGPATATDAGLLNYYSTLTDTTTVPSNSGTGPLGYEVKAVRVGNLVTLTAKVTTGTSVANDSMTWASGTLTTDFRPSTQVIVACNFNTDKDWINWIKVTTIGQVILYMREFDSTGIISRNFDDDTEFVGTISYVVD